MKNRINPSATPLIVGLLSSVVVVLAASAACMQTQYDGSQCGTDVPATYPKCQETDFFPSGPGLGCCTLAPGEGEVGWTSCVSSNVLIIQFTNAYTPVGNGTTGDCVLPLLWHTSQLGPGTCGQAMIPGDAEPCES